jgi:hypothetical protein
MPEFDQVFDGDLAQRGFFIISVIFAIMYATAAIFMLRVVPGSGRKVLRRRTVMTALLVALGMSAIAGGFWGLRASSREAATSASVSVMTLQSQVDTKTLPEQQVGDLF